jgi:hypothetical protein
VGGTLETTQEERNMRVSPPFSAAAFNKLTRSSRLSVYSVPNLKYLLTGCLANGERFMLNATTPVSILPSLYPTVILEVKTGPYAKGLYFTSGC